MSDHRSGRAHARLFRVIADMHQHGDSVAGERLGQIKAGAAERDMTRRAQPRSMAGIMRQPSIVPASMCRQSTFMSRRPCQDRPAAKSPQMALIALIRGDKEEVARIMADAKGRTGKTKVRTINVAE